MKNTVHLKLHCYEIKQHFRGNPLNWNQTLFHSLLHEYAYSPLPLAHTGGELPTHMTSLAVHEEAKQSQLVSWHTLF